MAEIPAEASMYPNRGLLFKWPSVSQSDTCEPVTIEGPVELSFQAIPAASWGAGDTVALHGSLQQDVAKESASYGPISDGGGTAISLTANKIQYVGPVSHHYKPVPGGSTGTIWTIYLLAKFRN